MKEGIHPEYNEVVFQDMSSGFKFVSRSTIRTKETIEFEGKKYPLVKLDVSSESHPFYTGAQNKALLNANRVKDFEKKFAHLRKSKIA